MQSVSRRGVLGGAVVALAGCTGVGRDAPSPSSGTTSPPASATTEPGPDPDLVAAADEEAEGGWYTSLARRARTLKAPAGFAPWCLASADARTTHASLLSQRDPLSGENGDQTPWFTPTPTPPARPATYKAALTTIFRWETGLSKAHVARAMATDDPSMVLLWASLATSAHARRRPGPLPSTVQVTPAPIQAPPRTQALGLLLAHTHVLIAGMEVGLGALPFRDPHYSPGRERLSELESMRDAVIAKIRSAGATPEPPRLDYELPPMTTPASVVEAWGTLEIGVLEGWAAVATASGGAERERAIAAMFDQADAATGYDVGLGTWPGWV